MFGLTPFQFNQLYKGYDKRQRIAAIHRAEILVTVINSNRWDDKQKAVQIPDLLAWYDDFVAGRDVNRPQETVELQREIDESVPQLERITKRLLEQRDLNPDEIKQDSAEWKDAEELARKCLTGGRNVDDAEVTPMDGFVLQKADPKVWGEKPPWEDED